MTTWFAPGRANLMGEHTDYNGGMVLPFALTHGVTATASARSDGLLALRSKQVPGDLVTVDVAALEPGSVPGWAAYPAGVAWSLARAGFPVPGADIDIDSDLPVGAGVSSSAALECSVALALCDLRGVRVERRELAAIARRAENEFVGAPTGMIDQFAALLCERGHAMLLDCGKAEIRQVPFGPAEAGLVALVIDTKVAHALVSGEYAARRAECEEAARQLGISSLGSLTTLPPLADPVLRRRARHVFTDSARARAIADALDSQRVAETIGVYRFIGELLTEGHASLRDDFEVSWPEADVTVETALAAGALGAKMIGGGFGGSVLALVPKDRLLAVRAAVSAEFERRSWVGPEFLNAIPSQSARKLLFPYFPGGGSAPLRPPKPSTSPRRTVRLPRPGLSADAPGPGAARRTRAWCSLAPARCAARAPPSVADNSRRTLPTSPGACEHSLLMHAEEDEVAQAQSTVLDEAAAIAGDIAELRHAIHREPEIGLDLPKTQRKVLGALDGLPLEITTGERLSSVTAVLRGGKPGPTVLLRGDMDALPVREATTLPYASTIDGSMHACGHDLHVAMLAGAAKLLSDRRADLSGAVIFMFQPGEEGYGGAEIMIEEEGLLSAAGERPVAAYGLHVSSDRDPAGAFSTRPGPLMAAADVIQVTVRGRGGHASRPHVSADPIPAACEMVTALQTLVTRRFDIFDPVVITVGSFHAGTVNNVIPDEATFHATLRSFSDETRSRLEVESARLVRDIGAAHGLSVEARWVPGYPVTVNDAGEAEFASECARGLFGADRVTTMAHPIPGAEDFSYVLRQVPGAFLFLGACPPGTDPATAPSNHSARAIFTDEVLADGTALLTELALRRLASARDQN